MKVPTDLADPVYFGKEQDCSVPSSGIYYVLQQEAYYPFAFYLENATVSDMAPLLNSANESAQISLLYPYFSAWAKDNSVHKDWYKTTKSDLTQYLPFYAIKYIAVALALLLNAICTNYKRIITLFHKDFVRLRPSKK